MQVVIILTVCKLLGLVLGVLKQPPVIGEIIGGVIVGPSVFGQWNWWLVHVFQSSAISPLSVDCIALVADLGIVLFMFMVGLELDERLVRRMWKTSFPIAVASVLFPFGVGSLLAIWVYPINNDYLAVPVGKTAFFLFFGASMSFTALPVLASLLTATRLISTPVGIQAISCATVDDVLAWCVLAVSTAFAKGDELAGLVTFALAIAYVLIMVLAVRPLLRLVHENYLRKGEELSSPTFSYCMIITLLLSAFFCEIINIHSFFGAFIAGLCAPKGGRWHLEAAHRMELVTKELLLPLFFVASGAKTDLSSINSGQLVGLVFAVWFIATVAKVLPATVMTRLMTGREWYPYSLTVGVLMNTRGLVELIALNIGFSLGILSQQVFTVLVLMALLTTFCTAPLVYLMYQRSYRPELERQSSGRLQALHTVREDDMVQSPADADVVWHYSDRGDEKEQELNKAASLDGIELEPNGQHNGIGLVLAGEEATTPKHFLTSGSAMTRSGGGGGLMTSGGSGGGRVIIHSQGNDTTGPSAAARFTNSGSSKRVSRNPSPQNPSTPSGSGRQVSAGGGGLNSTGPAAMQSGLNTSGPGRLHRTPHPADTLTQSEARYQPPQM